MNNYEKIVTTKFEALSPTLKKVAVFLKEEPKFFASKSASKIASLIGVSETSVIRFVYAIGYSSFSELQNEVQDSVFEIKTSLQHLTSSIEISSKNGIDEVMIRDQINIKKTAENIDPIMFKEVVDKIAAAREVLVLGSGASFGFAHWFGNMLNMVRGNSRVLNLYTDDFSFISALDEKCVLITFSFNRYMKQTLELSKELKKQGVYVVGITDSNIAPITHIANSIFITRMSHMSTIDSGPVIASLINTIINQIINDYPTEYSAQRKRYISSYKNLFWSEELYNDIHKDKE